MSGRSVLLRASDLVRYARALRAAGVPDWRIVVKADGSHEIVISAIKDEVCGPDPDELLR